MDKRLEDFFNDTEKFVLSETSVVSLDAAAEALSALVNSSVQITASDLTLNAMGEVGKEYPFPSLLVSVRYENDLTGEIIYILQNTDAVLIAGLMMGAVPEETARQLSEMEMSAVNEAMSQMVGASVTALSGSLGINIKTVSPDLISCNLKEEKLTISDLNDTDPVLIFHFNLKIGEQQSRFVQVVPVTLAKSISSLLLKNREENDETYNADAAEETAEETAEGGLLEQQKDVLAEVGNISLGAAATVLSQLVNRGVQITTPKVSLKTMKEIRDHYPVPCLVARVFYLEGLDGDNVLVIKKEDALTVVGLMMGMEPPEKPHEMGDLELSAISEAMNQMMGATATAMSDFFDRRIDISHPELVYRDLNVEGVDLDEVKDDTILVQIAFRIEIDGLVDSEILQIIPLSFARDMSDSLLACFSAEKIEEKAATVLEDESEREMEEEGEEKKEAYTWEEGRQIIASAEKMSSELPGDDYAKLELIKDIPVEVWAILGKNRIPLKQAFSLHSGEIVDLDRYVGEPVDLFANERLVAKGEVVLVNGYFGVKITSIAYSTGIDR